MRKYECKVKMMNNASKRKKDSTRVCELPTGTRTDIILNRNITLMKVVILLPNIEIFFQMFTVLVAQANNRT